MHAQQGYKFDELRISQLTQKIAVIGGGFSGAAAVNHLLTFHNRCLEKAGYVLAFQNSGIEWQDMKAVELGEYFPTPPKIKVTMFHDGQFSSIGRGVHFKEDQPEWLCPNFSLDKFSFSDVLVRDPQVPNRSKVGEHIHQQFLDSPKLGELFSHREEKVEKISREGDQWLVNGELFDAVILCEGHSPNPAELPESPRIVKNPYNPEEIRKILSEPQIFIRGFGDTTLDVLNSLYELNYNGDIGIISRKLPVGLGGAIRSGTRLQATPRNKGLNFYLDKITLIEGIIDSVGIDGEIKVTSNKNKWRFKGVLIDAAPFSGSRETMTENKEPVPKLLRQLYKDGVVCKHPEAEDFARVDGSLIIKGSSRPTMSPAIFAIGPNIHSMRALSAEEFAHQSYEAAWSVMMAFYQRAWQLSLMDDS